MDVDMPPHENTMAPAVQAMEGQLNSERKGQTVGEHALQREMFEGGQKQYLGRNFIELDGMANAWVTVRRQFKALAIESSKGEMWMKWGV